MTDQEIQIECAKLDGFTDIYIDDITLPGIPVVAGTRNGCVRAVFDYPNSYDAIIPSTQKRPIHIKEAIKHSVKAVGKYRE